MSLATIEVDGVIHQATNSAGQPIHPDTDGLIKFWRWFRDSATVDALGRPIVFYHGTNGDIESFDQKATIDGGFHFGDQAQANMRVSGAGKNLIPVYLSVNALRRSVDAGCGWRSKIQSAKSSGADGIAYLNRYEGLSTSVITRLSDSGLLNKLHKLSDKDFRIAVPEARDSYIVFDPARIKSAIGNIGDFSVRNPVLTDRQPLVKKARP